MTIRESETASGLDSAEQTREVRRRQRGRAIVTAWILGFFAVLFFFITIAKIGLN